MAPAKKHGRQPGTSPRRANPIVKPRQTTDTRKGLRSQDKTPVSQASLSRPVPTSSSLLATIPQTVHTKRKRSQDSEGHAARPAKQLRTSRPTQLEPFDRNLQEDSGAEAQVEDLEPPPLSNKSEEDLRTLYKEVTDSAASNASALKRTSSRRSLASLEADTVRSQRSSNTAAHYRYKYLENANVYIHVDPPENIRIAIDDIINANPSEDRRAILCDKAKVFSNKCGEIVRAAAGEDDFVHLFYNVLEDLSPKNLLSREKADWRIELKPTIQQSDANLSFLSSFDAIGSDEQQNVDDAPALPPPKRYQQFTGGLYISPQNSQIPSLDSPPENRPAQPDKTKETSPIKTSRPDITTGIKESALISALVFSLSSPEFNHTKAKQFLDKLQDATMPSQRNGAPEPVLIIVPTQRESNLTFPTLVFEGKGYSTGKQVFEAQNQAAVSGAGGIKIQLMLDEVVKRATKSCDAPSIRSTERYPLVFSLCSEGPHHELWAHYTVVEDGQRRFNMVLVNTCHGVIPKQVEEFFVQVDNVMNWTVGAFLESVVDGLGKVARKAMA